MNFKSILVFLIFCIFKSSLACEGYKAKIKNIENCAGDDQVVVVEPGFQVELTKNCEVVPHGCVVSKGFATAKGKYSLKKEGIPLVEKSGDLCAAASSANGEVKNFMKIFGVPDHCPVKDGKLCADGSARADFSKYKTMLSMARGNFVVEADIEHDTGKSCFRTEFEITK